MHTHIYDEMHADINRTDIRAHYGALNDWLSQQPAELLASKRDQADLMFRKVGITFAVYGEDEDTERLIPFDLVPRIFPAAEWQGLEKGLRQRVQALNLFLHDVFHEQNIIKAGIIPAERIFNNSQ